MKRYTYKIERPSSDFLNQLMNWAQQFSTCALFHSNQYQNAEHQFIVAADEIESINAEDSTLEHLKNFIDAKQGEWLFGGFSYDLKNDLEPQLSSNNFDGIEFPDFHFFEAKHLFFLEGESLQIHSPFTFYELVDQIEQYELPYHEPSSIELHHRIEKTQYLTALRKIKDHLAKGDIYEMNFCQEFYAEETDIQAIEIFKQLNQKAKAPFSSFYKIDDKYLICSSPERYIKKKGKKVISQPIKGTAKRGSTPEEDAANIDQLQNSTKEQAENVMIVDLVRNDFARTAVPGTVKVDELFKVYTFEQVHQLISTVGAEIEDNVHLMDLIKTTFPMGSMTGAPKVMSMELIEQYEQTKRGWFSGTVGMIEPNGDFDFNVIIRSILYNDTEQYLSIQAGGAITHSSIPDDEYEESLLKVKAMKEVLSQKV